jgi:hemerythrin-like domain-containing protein
VAHSAPLPGFEAPAVGFEQPFEMLVACHERVQRSLDLLQRLMDYLDTRGHDRSTRSAAADVLRYFDIAAPLHHEDEELHVFPALAGSADPQAKAAVDTLQRDHARMAEHWAALRGALLRWRDEDNAPLPDAATRSAAAAFIGLYAAHIAIEEDLVYPAARTCFDDAGLARIGAEMQARRRAP